MRALQAVALFSGLVLAQQTHAQSSDPFVRSMRAYGHDVGDRLVIGASALPAEHYGDHVVGENMTIAAMLLDLSSRTELYCAAVAATRPPDRSAVLAGAPNGTVISRLRAAFLFCDEVLAGIHDESLDQIAPWYYEYVRELQRSRAFVATQLIALWSSGYERLRGSLRMNGLVPPRVCIGGGDCDSGENLCKGGAPPRFGGTLLLSDAPFSITSDGRGAYANDKQGATIELGTSLALIFTSVHHPDASSLRSIRIDLSKPVPNGGGVPLGVLTVPSVVRDDRVAAAAGDIDMSRSTYASIFAQWYSDSNQVVHNVSDIPVGTAVEAEQLDVNFDLKGVAHLLQMGPQPMWHCLADKPAIRGVGTTRATISRPLATQFILDLPAGSVGRLFDVHLLPANALDKGLYYVSLHLAIDIDPQPHNDR